MLKSIPARWRVKRFIDHWIEYRDLVLDDGGGERIEPSKEEHLLKLQAKLATSIQAIEDTVPTGISSEAHHELASITSLLKRYKRLADRNGWSAADRESFEQEWHEQYIWLNKLKGAALEKKPASRPQRPAKSVPSGLEKSWVPRRFTLGKPFRFLFVLLLLVLAVYALSWGLGVRWTGSQGFSAGGDGSRFSVFLANVLNGLNAIWTWIAGFLTPVVATYGLTWTIILFVLLFIAIGYWFAARG